MKKLDNSQCNSNNYFTQDKSEHIYELHEDLAILIDEYVQELPKELVCREIMGHLRWGV